MDKYEAGRIGDESSLKIEAVDNREEGAPSDLSGGLNQKSYSPLTVEKETFWTSPDFCP